MIPVFSSVCCKEATIIGCTWSLIDLELFYGFRLRENSDQNRAPKLVRQLTYDSRVDDTLRDLSNQVQKNTLNRK